MNLRDELFRKLAAAITQARPREVSIIVSPTTARFMMRDPHVAELFRTAPVPLSPEAAKKIDESENPVFDRVRLEL